jgi:predicted negative regulator of RcsB-dependent stress response
MKLKVFVTVMLVFLVGCSTFPEKLAEREVVAAESQKAAKVNLNRSLDKLTPEVLYLLLTAELAAQRGMYDVALDGYVQAAGKVFDPRIAERATKIALFRKNYREAQKAASLWLERDPENLLFLNICSLF